MLNSGIESYLNEGERRYLNELVERKPELIVIQDKILDAYLCLRKCYCNKGKLLIAGNGGSASDAEHIAGELMKSFVLPRKISTELAERLLKIDEKRGSWLKKDLEMPLTAIPLVAHEALSTAYMNDVSAENVFAQQLLGYGQRGDVFLGISTSGNSSNVIQAAIVAKAIGARVIALTGNGGGDLAKYADILVNVPENKTYLIQEIHLPIYHCWCLMLEEHFFGSEG